MKGKGKETRRKAFAFSKAMSRVPKLEVNELAILNHKGNLKKIHPLKVKVDGVAFETVLDMYDRDKKELIKKNLFIKGSETALARVLIEYGYKTPSVDLNALIEDIKHLKLIHPNKVYYNIVEDEDGYVKSKQKVQHILEDDNFPEDFDKGYWKIVNGEWVLDNERFNQYWAVI